ncbi:MAG TPA: hypothetical protein VEW74_06505 [Candidatus Nitrosotalea sp.]|nr:hypothetical protein [Candidatus Nitrosotalea sp.]
MSYRALFGRCAPPAAAIVLFALPVAGPAATIDQIAGRPANYDGQHVDVNGTVEHLARKVSHQGNPYVTFTLCSAHCVNVIAFGDPAMRNGQTLTVHGTYANVQHVGGNTLYNAIVSDGTGGDTETPCS